MHEEKDDALGPGGEVALPLRKRMGGQQGLQTQQAKPGGGLAQKGAA